MKKAKRVRDEKGITLVALIITIIVLIILAAISIGAVFNSRIIDTATNGVVDYIEAQSREELEFDELDQSIKGIVKKIEGQEIGGGSSSGTKPGKPKPTPYPTALPVGWDENKVEAWVSVDNVVVPVPKGFVASKAEEENTEENGFVIYQGTEEVTDDNVETAMITRNQFVWVPVPDTSKMFGEYNGKAVGKLYDFNTDTKTYSEIAWSDTGNREPDVVTGDDGTKYDAVASNYSDAGITGITNAYEFKVQLETEFEEMKASVEKYHGFYIGRYEVGTGEKVMQGISTLQGGAWYKHYQISKEIINANGIKSSMIWGSQWDQVMIWFDTQGGENKEYVYDSTGKGQFVGVNSPNTYTGEKAFYAVNNIYDMAGNDLEWTLEVSGNDSRIFRSR